MSKKFKFFIFIFGLLGLFWAANFALAQGGADFGIEAVNNGLNNSLVANDPRIIIGRIIQIVLSFLGVIALVLIMYAGFLWMTSEGDEEKIGKAKQILKNAIIGLIIILSSWAITTFLLSRLSEAMGINGGGFTGGKAIISQGTGAIGACTVESVYPTADQKDVPRNSSIIITFKEEIKLDSVCINGQGDSCTCNTTTCNKINPQAIKIFKADLGDACTTDPCSSPNSNITDVLITVASGNKTLVLTPLTFLGSPNNNTNYVVKFTNRVKKLDDSSMFKNCNADFFNWGFQVNTSLDLTPPRVSLGGIFPIPDNIKDIFKQITPAKKAAAKIIVAGCPKVFSAATVQSVIPAGPTIALDYHGALSKFKVSIPAPPDDNKAQLFDEKNNLLGVATFDSSGQAVFANYFKIKVQNYQAGNAWDITISPEQLADNLTVGSSVYVFAATGENNNIVVPGGTCTEEAKNTVAANMGAKLSGNPDIESDYTNKTVSLAAHVAGVAGNDLALNVTGSSALTLQPFAGGVDRDENNEIKDKKDRPMNSVIQINFNEAINPVTVSGTANEVAAYIRIVNALATSSPAGAACDNNSDCRSYKCENKLCVGDYLGGKFMVSNGYRTVEFISDKECGVNGCGEKIYCLPAKSHLAVELMSANLRGCLSNDDCLAYSPFTKCSSTAFTYKTCQNPANKNYPTANLSQLDGLVDAAINSFDGDRNIYADGPLSFYDDNLTPEANLNKWDNYKWSFYISDKIAIEPPQITFIKPIQGEAEVKLTDPIQINFNVLMMNSSLRTGSALVSNGSSTFEHKLLNLGSSTPTPLGYWILCDNQDSAPLDGEPDITIANINHYTFLESVTYKAQVGSGVKDIYQNCYKPSAGPTQTSLNCGVSQTNPSCCFGVATSTLNAAGNCQ
ncbi:MAG: hypothetical protein WC523_05360 [Patescibacteria group bacterium]|jgi:hypothetical protein